MNTFFEVTHSKETHVELINLLEVQFVRCKYQVNTEYPSSEEEDYRVHIMFVNGKHQEVWMSKESYDAFVKALNEVNEVT